MGKSLIVNDMSEDEEVNQQSCKNRLNGRLGGLTSSKTEKTLLTRKDLLLNKLGGNGHNEMITTDRRRLEDLRMYQ
jgi:hypothetical protein